LVIRELADLTWEDVRDLAGARAVALLPVGALEAHGPHLPLGTDVIIAEQMARAAGARIAERGFTPVLLPALPFTAAPFAARFPGTIAVEPQTVQALVVDVARELTRHRFSVLGIANAHLDPAHTAALAAAQLRCREQRLLPLACPDVSRRPWVQRLTDEFRTGACHAGRYEGSVVMASRPELVKESIRAALPPNPRSLATAIKEGVRTFDEAGGPRAYFGWPADATAAEGRETIAVLGEILAEAVLAELEPETAA
jgi:creatinine amidohydrolase